jgi:hypothetical protein
MRRALTAAGLVALGGILAAIFIAYFQPGILLDASNLRYCG